MSIDQKILEKINEIFYTDLEKCLKKLNKRIHLKLFTLVHDGNGGIATRIRVKKTVSLNDDKNRYSIIQHNFPSLEDVCEELQIAPLATEHISSPDGLKDYFEQRPHFAFRGIKEKKDSGTNMDGDVVPATLTNRENCILYSNHLSLNSNGKSTEISYILEIWNVDPVSRSLFYENPDYSYLRMTLDYFCQDYFAVDVLLRTGTDPDSGLNSKYNENPVLFNRRIARLFFGKMQQRLLEAEGSESTDYENGQPFSHTYYINNLLEYMDDISGLTYENANPFGSILFMHSSTILHSRFIRFSIRFKESGRISLEDSRRIRKLLELTNGDRDLYLIADHSHIYGLGEANWNFQRDALVLRLDFRGLSKFRLSLIRTDEERSKSGALMVEDERKFYSYDLALMEHTLLSVTSKTPRLGEEGYSSERFVNLLQNVFWNKEMNETVKLKSKVLDLIVRKAREQKHGTMVVIAEPETARNELEILQKQSTLIDPNPINPEHIQFLTSIDGAIYFDTSGHCHAIGVILDGIAKVDIGDASRGARFNSAHRYLQKLKDDGAKKCVIAIISEDGMVNLIPEIENEEQLLTITYEIINLINDKNSDFDSLSEKEDILLNSSIADSEWLLQVGVAYSQLENYGRALVFMEQALEQAKNEFVSSYLYNYFGYCLVQNHFEEQNDGFKLEKAIEMFEKAVSTPDKEEDINVYYSNLGMTCSFLASYYNQGIPKNLKQVENYSEKGIVSLTEVIKIKIQESVAVESYIYTNRAKCFSDLGKMKGNKEKKLALFRKAIADYNLAIDADPNDEDIYWELSLILIDLKEYVDAAKRLIEALNIQNEQKYWDKLLPLFDIEPKLVAEAVSHYKEITGKTEVPEQLKQPFELYRSQLETNELESATAKEQQQNLENTDTD
ncbi:tetratricopeptide repeat protein [Paenibacillus rhizophilus]|uniref:tetratricopeptide repeat protein n=1 Tax=Paenibacillus rhizophilus TaxID=1850366 RepID=UPI00163A67D5|nr:tetratricopeptide repeat protein [Paenibacillus rhizophilus]